MSFAYEIKKKVICVERSRNGSENFARLEGGTAVGSWLDLWLADWKVVGRLEGKAGWRVVRRLEGVCFICFL